MHGAGEVISDRAVRSVFVARSTSIHQLFGGIGGAYEPVGVQPFRPKLAVERLDAAIVGGLAGAWRSRG